jgi:hypothetical protein
MNYYYITKLHLIVSDEIPDNYYYDSFKNSIENTQGAEYGKSKHCYKVFAGIPELPSINILNQQDKDRLGWIDVEQIAKEFDKHKFRHWKRELTNKEFYEIAEDGIKAGLQHQLSTKRYSEEDLIEAIKLTRGTDVPLEKIIEWIDQPKLIPIEIEIESNQITILKCK